MSASSEEPRKGDRVFRIALAASLLLHVAVALAVLAFSDEANRLLGRIEPRHHARRAPDETVTISSAIRIEKRAKAATSATRQPAAVTRTVHPPRPPVPQAVAARPLRVIPRPVVSPPPPLKHELAKLVPAATPQPPRTLPSRPPARQVASAPHALPERETADAAQPKSALLSQAQLARIQSDLAKTIAQARAEDNPLSNETRRQTAASTRRYAIDFSGLGGELRGAQGICEPIKMWQADGYDYYYETCRTQHPDGTVRNEPVPWPQRFPAGNDPLRMEQPPGGSIPLQLPPPGWRPDPGTPIDPDLLSYLRERGYHI